MGCSQSVPSPASAPGVSKEQAAKDAAISSQKKKDALCLAEELFAATKGQRFHEFYSRLTLTSYGASCKVLTAYHRTTGQKVAVKAIPKNNKVLERQRQKVLHEIGIFRTIEDHPNTVKVLEVFEGAECYYIVMECCEGGELFDHISKMKSGFTERDAASILRSLMLFCAHMHSRGLAHLDIKPENIMFDSGGVDGVLKVIDFGSSVFVQEIEMVKNAFGTVRYSSPEMANDICGQKSDIWSVGVVMYILLSGKAPFLKTNDTDTLNLIKSGPRVRFTAEKWAGISQAAKDCIRSMLEPSHEARPTAADILQMPWLKAHVPDTVIQADILKHLRNFSNQSRIRRLLLGLMADQLVGGEANRLLGQFYSMDEDFSGTLEVNELIKAAKEVLPDLTDEEIRRMFTALDSDQTGTVDVHEFFAGLLSSMSEDKLASLAQKSFTMLDRRGKGYVTKDIFMEVVLERAQHMSSVQKARRLSPAMPNLTSPDPCAGPGSLAMRDGDEVMLDPQLVLELEGEFQALDANGDGVLSFDEFKGILGIQKTAEGMLQLRRRASCSVTPTPGDVAAVLHRAAASAASPGASGGGGQHQHYRPHHHLPVDLEGPQMPTKELLELLVPAASKTRSGLTPTPTGGPSRTTTLSPYPTDNGQI